MESESGINSKGNGSQARLRAEFQNPWENKPNKRRIKISKEERNKRLRTTHEISWASTTNLCAHASTNR
jgi:hypothetical protein